ncbi:MAG: hypothetical protein AAGJ84_11610 [Pseudomonadota bacterium]
MSPTETTVFAVVLVGVMMITGPERGLWALLISLPFGVASAFNLPALGGSSMLVSDIAALTFAALILGRLFIGGQSLQLNFLPLSAWIVAMLAYCMFITFFGPRIFENQIDVFTIGRSGTHDYIVRTTLHPSSKNVSQLLVFGISLTVCLAILLANAKKICWAFLPAVIAMTLMHLALCLADVVTYLTNRAELLSFIRNANYSVLYDHEIEGIKRVIGGFAEASAAGNFSLALFGFWLVYWMRGGSFSQSWLLVVGSLAVVFASGSSAGFVALSIFLLIVFAYSFLVHPDEQLARRGGFLVFALFAVMPLTVAGVFVLAETNPGFGAYFDRLLFSKLESDSGVERMMWNRHALNTAIESNLIGVGLGSVRSSNFLIACLSTLGLIGSLIYFGLLLSFSLSRPIGNVRDERTILAHAARGACLALFCKAIVTKSSPDLEVVFFAFLGVAVLLQRPMPKPNFVHRLERFPAGLSTNNRLE